ncbi:MAG: tetratricopeptide repeat protein [Treponema sp.]|nr:tetratricopeptide repeat protein [Treponema sp.]
MNTEVSIEGLIQKAYTMLKASDVASARKTLEEALEFDFDHLEVKYGLKCLNWWTQQMRRVPELRDPYDKGGYILSQWKPYYSYLEHFPESYDRCQYAIRIFVYSAALGFFEGLLEERKDDPGLLLQMGRCRKGTGNYEEALAFLEDAARFAREDSETLAELADVNALLSEHRAAKALFREAFFFDPQKIELGSMESEMIVRLRDKVGEMGYSGALLAEWLPVYGCLFGVFSVKRELKQAELGKLKQSIFSLESDIRSGGRTNGFLKPRLINRYFWLIDHYENIREDPELIEEIMLKIKLIEPAVYERYTR